MSLAQEMFKFSRENDMKKRPTITIGTCMECVEFPAFIDILKFSAGKATIKYDKVNIDKMLDNSVEFKDELARINDPEGKSCGSLVKFLVEFDHPLIMKTFAEYFNKKAFDQEDLQEKKSLFSLKGVSEEETLLNMTVRNKGFDMMLQLFKLGLHGKCLESDWEIFKYRK